MANNEMDKLFQDLGIAPESSGTDGLDALLASAEAFVQTPVGELPDEGPSHHPAETERPELAPSTQAVLEDLAGGKEMPLNVPIRSARQGIYSVRKESNPSGGTGYTRENARGNGAARVRSADRAPASKKSARKKPIKKLSPRTRRSIYLFFFPLAIFYMELINMFHTADPILGWGVIYTFLFSVGFGFGCLFLISLMNRKAAYITSIVLSSILLLIFGIQTVYFTIFKTFTVLAMAGMAADAITGFFGATVSGIFRSLFWLILLAVPLLLVIFFGERVLPKKHNKPVAILFILAACLIFTFGCSTLVRANTTDLMSYRYVYDETFEVDLSVPRFGILTTVRQEIRNWIWEKTGYVPPKYEEPTGTVQLEQPQLGGNTSPGTASGGQTAPELSGKSSEQTDPSSGATVLIGGGVGKSGTSSEGGSSSGGDPGNGSSAGNPPVTSGPVDTSPHVLDSIIVTNSGNKKIEDITAYLNSVEPTNKNKYTGMFEGYNLIYICAEGFSRYAVDQTHTPTLWKLSHEGFVFKNFYNPIWTHSTSDGEFAMLTGLVPYSGERPFYTTIDNSSGGKNNMYFSPAKVFQRLGYVTKAYHGHYWDYYGRDQTHPNLGYDYIGVGHGMYFRGSSTKNPGYYMDSSGASSGLVIDYTWPESDVQVVDVTTDQYIGSKPFHVYYMTISGHGNYSYEGNAMCKKHWADVADMTVNDAAKAYVACNMELDLSMKLLIDKLQAGGVLDKTVIVLCGDHYPYLITGNGSTVSDDGLATLASLAGEPLDKKFELYRSTLIIWNSKMGTIPVEKYCYSVDILPTVYNLFGVEYDSRLFMGTDILSDSQPLIVFSDRSFITDLGRYNASSNTFTPNPGVTVPEGYASQILTQVKNKAQYSKLIIENDYYNYVVTN